MVGKSGPNSKKCKKKSETILYIWSFQVKIHVCFVEAVADGSLQKCFYKTVVQLIASL